MSGVGLSGGGRVGRGWLALGSIVLGLWASGYGLAGTCFHRAGALGEWVWPGWHLVLLLSGLPCVYGLAGTWFHRAGALIECLGLAGTWFFCYQACLVSMAWLALGSIALGLWPNPMVCKWLLQPLSSIARSLSKTPME